jgi:ribokinase
MNSPSENCDRRQGLWVIGSYIEAHCWFVSQRPQSDESQQARHYTRECAGKGLAVALGAHRLGASVELCMAVGHDAAGDAALQLLHREGLAAGHVHRLGAHSGQGCGLIGAHDGSSVTIYPGANALLGEAQLQQAAACAQRAAVAYAQCEVPLPTVAKALEMALAAGAISVLNPSPWPEGGLSSAAGAQALAAARVVVANRSEAVRLLAELTGWVPGSSVEEDLQQLRALPAAVLEALWARWPGQWLVLTLGAQGCVAYGREQHAGLGWQLPGHSVVAVQPIGAGDAFSAGLCTALAHGHPLAQALEVANACGARAASQEGILAALPQREAVASLLA